MTQKIVISVCFGGFGFSKKAFERLIELGVPVYTYTELKNHRPENTFISKDDGTSKFPRFDTENPYYLNNEKRDDSRLIQVVEELGKEANSEFSKLKIVEIPDDVAWEISEYDGWESVEEVHRSWN